MNRKFYFDWPYETIIITSVLLVVIICIIIYIIKSASVSSSPVSRYVKIAIAVILVVIEVCFSAKTPIYLLVSEREVRMHQVVGNIKIPIKEILRVEAIDPKAIANSIRKNGSGGAGGYTGLFYNKTLGNYYMYATKKTDLVLIETASTKYVFSCSRRLEFLSSIKKQLHSDNNKIEQ